LQDKAKSNAARTLGRKYGGYAMGRSIALTRGGLGGPRKRKRAWQQVFEPEKSAEVIVPRQLGKDRTAVADIY
jgi:hypothetical protein